MLVWLVQSRSMWILEVVYIFYKKLRGNVIIDPLASFSGNFNTRNILFIAISSVLLTFATESFFLRFILFYCRFVYLLTEFCPGGELFDQLVKQDKFNNDQARFYSACVVEAFDYLHQRRIAHRDLKVIFFLTLTFFIQKNN